MSIHGNKLLKQLFISFNCEFIASSCKFDAAELSLEKRICMAENQLSILYRHRLLWHLLFWIATLVVYWLTFAGYQDRYYEEFFMNLYLLPARMIGTYSLIYFILPLATEKKKFVAFGVLILIHAIAYGFLIQLTFYIIKPFPEIYRYANQSIFDLSKILVTTISNYGIPVLAAAIIIFKKWHIDALKNQKLTEEKMSAELNFLKAQIHPHFLFNTLNNLYGLTLIKSEKTSDVVLKLSDLLDYMIYKSNDDFVPLSKELEILDGYIELEKMRYNERLDFHYEIVGEIDAHKIAPLILLPFIENCFKHGASNDRSSPIINIRLEVNPSYLNFVAINSISAEKASDSSINEGIGLANVKRRLQLIYPEQHKLEIVLKDKQFKVELKIFWKT